MFGSTGGMYRKGNSSAIVGRRGHRAIAALRAFLLRRSERAQGLPRNVQRNRKRRPAFASLAPSGRPVVVRAACRHGVEGRRLLTKPPSTPASSPPSTPVVPPERRAGIYESDEDVTALLWYGTHVILSVPRGSTCTSAGIAGDCDLVLKGDGISAHHFMMERRPSGLVVRDAGSTNGLAYEVKRDLGLALKPSFEDKRATEPFLLVPGMTFVVGAEPSRSLTP